MLHGLKHRAVNDYGYFSDLYFIKHFKIYKKPRHVVDFDYLLYIEDNKKILKFIEFLDKLYIKSMLQVNRGEF